MSMLRDFITLLDYTETEITALLDLADTLRDAGHAGRLPQNLKGKSLALNAKILIVLRVAVWEATRDHPHRSDQSHPYQPAAAGEPRAAVGHPR
ncbi:MAG: hypothetical protein J7M39_14575 [Anaerolineae bacterium]|nr:hypothetical protein [Anaerolineae bacterium]